MLGHLSNVTGEKNRYQKGAHKLVDKDENENGHTNHQPNRNHFYDVFDEWNFTWLLFGWFYQPKAI